MIDSSQYLAALPEIRPIVCGRLTGSVGLLLEATGPDLPLGSLVMIKDRNARTVGQVVGFREERLLLLAIDEMRQLAPGSLVAPLHLTFKVGSWVLGRVLDGLGRPLDGLPIPPAARIWSSSRPAWIRCLAHLRPLNST
jgi:flagellar biosynthesis/type III secretory pathway ATPase